MEYKAYAKINLALFNKGLMKNGYHELDMIVSEIDLYDSLYIEKANGDTTIIGMEIPLEKNLIYQAIVRFKQKFNINDNFKVVVEKRIPEQAGLGGGSSDASCTLKALCEMYNIKCEKEILEICESLGSDVPFFYYGGICRVKGRGEQIKQISSERINNVIIVKPNYGLSTKEIFNESDKYSYADKTKIIDEMEENINDINTITKLMFNDLQTPSSVITKDREDGINNILEEMKKDALGAMMTGSGSAIFGIYDNDNIDKAYNRLKKKYANWFVQKI